MSAIDPDEWRGEFDAEIDDWWAQLWALRISAVVPLGSTKNKFISFVHDRCGEAGSRRIDDSDLSNLFSDFLDGLVEGSIE
tara:strand:- start:445 stop:687 length:243 start_codon:yes stop_codon:yes gene_type:complete